MEIPQDVYVEDIRSLFDSDMSSDEDDSLFESTGQCRMPSSDSFVSWLSEEFLHDINILPLKEGGKENFKSGYQSRLLFNNASVSEASLAHPFEAGENFDPKYLSRDYKPGPWDVLCGRGEKYFNQVGNRRLRVLAAYYLSSYMHAKHRFERTKILSNIVHEVRDAGGRFLQQQRSGGFWYNISDADAMRKVCHLINYTCDRSSEKAGLPLDMKTKTAQDHLLFSSLNHLAMPTPNNHRRNKKQKCTPI